VGSLKIWFNCYKAPKCKIGMSRKFVPYPRIKVAMNKIENEYCKWIPTDNEYEYFSYPYVNGASTNIIVSVDRLNGKTSKATCFALYLWQKKA